MGGGFSEKVSAGDIEMKGKEGMKLFEKGASGSGTKEDFETAAFESLDKDVQAEVTAEKDEKERDALLKDIKETE